MTSTTITRLGPLQRMQHFITQETANDVVRRPRDRGLYIDPHPTAGVTFFATDGVRLGVWHEEGAIPGEKDLFLSDGVIKRLLHRDATFDDLVTIDTDHKIVSNQRARFKFNAQRGTFTTPYWQNYVPARDDFMSGDIGNLDPRLLNSFASIAPEETYVIMPYPEKQAYLIAFPSIPSFFGALAATTDNVAPKRPYMRKGRTSAELTPSELLQRLRQISPTNE